MTLRWAGFVTEPITGPRRFGSASPQRIAGREAAVSGSGCEVSRIWVERLVTVMAGPGSPERSRLPRNVLREPFRYDPQELGANGRARQSAPARPLLGPSPRTCNSTGMDVTGHA